MGKPLISTPAPAPSEQEQLERRFYARVSPGSTPAAASWLGPCQLWPGPFKAGYGVFTVAGRRRPAHHFAFTAQWGPLPRSTPKLDQVCHAWSFRTCRGGPDCPHRACVSLMHLEPVSAREYARRNAPFNPYVQAPRPRMFRACANGHVWSVATTIWDEQGRRQCLDCRQGLY